MVATRPPGIELRSILQVVGSGYPPHDTAYQGTGRFISVLAAEEEHWPEASAGTGLDDRLPHTPAVQFHVPAAPGAPGAATGVLRVGKGATSYGA